MKLAPLQPAPMLALRDIDGQPVDIGHGRKLLLSIFREAECPFCNVRVYELTHNHGDLRASGLDVVAIFLSEEIDVRRFVARQPRPFRMVADPYGRAHALYGNTRSTWGKLRAVFMRLPTMLRGMGMLGVSGGRTGNRMPADFLIDEDGRIVETYYGRDAGDHIPMARIASFAAA